MTAGIKILFLLFAAALLTLFALIVYLTVPQLNVLNTAQISSFEDCAAAGYPVMESYPRQCNTPDGKHFVEEIPAESSNSNGGAIVANGCAVAGCSGQLCVSADQAGAIVTTCEYRAEYACYQEASCEPQPNGECGWTPTVGLQACLTNPPALR